MAQFIASVLKFLVCLYIADNNQMEIFYTWYNSFDLLMISFSWELLTWLKFLLWLGSHYVIEVLTKLLAAIYAIFIAFYGNPVTKCNKENFCSTRCFRRGEKVPLQAYHRDLMILSCLMIREDWAPFFCRPLLDNYLFFSSLNYAYWRFSGLLTKWRKFQPPWPPPGMLTQLIGGLCMLMTYLFMLGNTMGYLSYRILKILKKNDEEQFFEAIEFKEQKAQGIFL